MKATTGNVYEGGVGVPRKTRRKKIKLCQKQDEEIANMRKSLDRIGAGSTGPRWIRKGGKERAVGLNEDHDKDSRPAISDVQRARASENCEKGYPSSPGGV